MTVAEMIAFLQTQNGHMQVLVDGYEGDFDDIDTVKVASVVMRYNTQPRGTEGHWAGRHVPAESGSGVHVLAVNAVEEPRELATPAVLIRRKKWEPTE